MTDRRLSTAFCVPYKSGCNEDKDTQKAVEKKKGEGARTAKFPQPFYPKGQVIRSRQATPNS